MIKLTLIYILLKLTANKNVPWTNWGK